MQSYREVWGQVWLNPHWQTCPVLTGELCPTPQTVSRTPRAPCDNVLCENLQMFTFCIKLIKLPLKWCPPDVESRPQIVPPFALLPCQGWVGATERFCILAGAGQRAYALSSSVILNTKLFMAQEASARLWSDLGRLGSSGSLTSGTPGCPRGDGGSWTQEHCGHQAMPGIC